MLDDALRRRLEDLNRGPLPGKAGSAGGGQLDRRAKGGTKEWRNEGREPLTDIRVDVPPSRHASVPSSCTSIPADTTAWLKIGQEVETPAGKHLRIVQPVEAIWKNGERLVAARHSILKQTPPRDVDARARRSREPATNGLANRAEIRALVDSFPDRAIFLDLETCGLAGAALFLIGLLRRIDGRLAVELLLARNYAEEKAVLVSLWQRAATHDVLVTFNGKSFDWPMVQDRSARYLLGRTGSAGPTAGAWGRSEAKPPATRDNVETDLIHVDILHYARRRWRGKLPDCKLQTLERYICGRRRQDDIPGAQIPAAYQRFVEKGDPREMESILAHNALDLVTLLDLSMRLAEA